MAATTAAMGSGNPDTLWLGIVFVLLRGYIPAKGFSSAVDVWEANGGATILYSGRGPRGYCSIRALYGASCGLTEPVTATVVASTHDDRVLAYRRVVP